MRAQRKTGMFISVRNTSVKCILVENKFIKFDYIQMYMWNIILPNDMEPFFKNDPKNYIHSDALIISFNYIRQQFFSKDFLSQKCSVGMIEHFKLNTV